MIVQLVGPADEGNPFRILLAEDNRVDALILQARFGKSAAPFEMRMAHNGADLFSKLFDQNNRLWPDVIILDIGMPDMTGLEVLQKLRSAPATRKVPVLILTVSHDERDISTARELGAQGYVIKGFTVSLDEIINFSKVASDHKQLWVCVGQDGKKAKGDEYSAKTRQL